MPDNINRKFNKKTPKITEKKLKSQGSGYGVRIPVEICKKYGFNNDSTVLFIEQEESLKILIKNEEG